jgi:Tfp pilus assembly protein PilN
MEGAAASVNSVANFITALKRSGYFQKVEIKETKQDEKTTGIQTFLFQMSAEISPPQLAPIAPSPQQPKAVGSPAAGAAPAKKG